MNGIPSTSEKIIAVIQARTFSERLPQKIFADLEGYPVLGLIILNLKRIRRIEEVWVATAEPGADEVAYVCRQFGAHLFIGDADDVLSRYIQVGEQAGAAIIVRATADNPFIDPLIPERTIELHRKQHADVAAFLHLPLGSSVETISLQALKESYQEISLLHSDESNCHKEHVSTYLKQNPHRFRIMHTAWPEELVFPENLRLTIDEKEDLLLARELAWLLKENRRWPLFSIKDILAIIEKEPHLININSGIKQRFWLHSNKVLS